MASKARTRAVGKGTGVAESKAPTVSAGRSALWVWLFAAGIIIAGGVYSPALNGPFIFDDYYLPFNNPKVESMPMAFWVGGVRPVLMASYWANYQISGVRTFSYHVVNLMLHTATAVVLFFLLQRLLKLAGFEGKTFLVSLFGAGLFLLHPLQSEPVAYIAGRSELVSGLFLLGAWLVFLNHFSESRTTLATAFKILLLGAAAVLGKESAISLPGVLFITDWYWNKAPLLDQIRGRWKLYVPIVFGGVVAAITIIHSLGRETGAGLSIDVTPFGYALTQCRVILTYLRLFVIPIGQNGDWQMPFFHSMVDGGARLYVAGILVLLGGIVFSYRREPLLSFGLLTFLVLLMPTSSFIPIRDAMTERRMYLPIIGLILASLAIVNRFHLDSVILRIGAMVVLILGAALTSQRSLVWGNDMIFWKEATQYNPGNVRAHLGLAGSYMRHGQFADALSEYDAVDRLNGPSEGTILSRITAYEYMHNSKLALDGLHKIAAMHPSAYTYNQIGHIEAVLGHTQEALAALNLAVTLDPKYTPAYVERGMVYLAIGDHHRAKADFQNALNIEPNNGNAITGLSKLVGGQ